MKGDGRMLCASPSFTRWGEPLSLSSPDSPETIGKRVALGLGFCLAVCILTIWGMKLQKK